ncbi:hypothetical protein DCAR_0518790 [Daucus carota subsp. sativus]|uniref:Xylanase inhibitor N-terminal domain-containing protein n=1 Tax=Daucus carota subsp. sativus TaxID=79200 RepID=A0AAF0X0C8_DAUCS|nr:hypothetical protein DCAR_0518790 [Daucus carota subsp. sativus]
MSSSIHSSLIILFFVFTIFSVSNAAEVEKTQPTALIFPVRKYTEALQSGVYPCNSCIQYYTTLNISKQDNNINLAMDLGGQHTWFNCDDFDLPTYKPISCNTEKCRKYKGYDCMNCALLIPVPPRCINNGCAVTYANQFAAQDINNSLAEDALFVESTNDVSVGLTYKSPEPFPFSCSDLLDNLASGTKDPWTLLRFGFKSKRKILQQYLNLNSSPSQLETIKLHVHLLKKPSPITEGCADRRWKYFKNCLGALNGTYVSVQVPSKDRESYRTRKGHLAMNVLGVCSPDLQFIYVLPGLEGSAHLRLK